MRGTDCTPEQVEAASQFLADRGWPKDIPLAALSRESIARMIAWYGALRYQAGRDGINSLEKPGEIIVKERTA